MGFRHGDEAQSAGVVARGGESMARSGTDGILRYDLAEVARTMEFASVVTIDEDLGKAGSGGASRIPASRGSCLRR
jgi:hypothetical protein